MTDQNFKIIDDDRLLAHTTPIFLGIRDLLPNFVELAKIDTPILIATLTSINTVIISEIFENPQDVIRGLCFSMTNHFEKINKEIKQGK